MPKIENGAIDVDSKSLIKVASCMPIQNYDRKSKLEWLNQALGETDCDLFNTPQEFFGGHYVMKTDRHMQKDWMDQQVGALARKHGKHLGVGACEKTETSGAMENFIFYDDRGDRLGHFSKFALPSYDDVRAEGHGQLWPETDYNRRTTPVDLPRLRIRVGCIFCWEVYSQTLWSAYSFARCSLIVSPIKFAPRGWLQNKKQSDGKLHIVGFGNAPKSEMWIDRLVMAGRHQCLCPIAVSCNSWNLGAKFMALVGHVDELKRTTELLNIPANGNEQLIHIFEMLPEVYTGLDHLHSAGAYKQHSGTVEGYSELGEFKMTAKIRRLEAHLIGGTTKLDCQLKAAALSRQKPSSIKRALGTGLQKVKKVKRG